MTFGERLKALRKKNRWTQDDIANRLEVTKQAVSGWERNTIAPSSKQLVQIADLFDVSIDFLVGRASSPFKQEQKEELIALQKLNGNHEPFTIHDLEEFFNKQCIQLGDYQLSSVDKSFIIEVLRIFKNHAEFRHPDLSNRNS